jgi:hypothetical protein
MNDLMSSSRIVAKADDEPDDPCGEQRAGRGRYAEEPDSRSQHCLGCRVNRPIVAPSAGHSHKSCCGTATLGVAPAGLGRRRNVADNGPRTGTLILHVDRDRGAVRGNVLRGFARGRGRWRGRQQVDGGRALAPRLVWLFRGSDDDLAAGPGIAGRTLAKLARVAALHRWGDDPPPDGCGPAGAERGCRGSRRR